MVRKKNKIKNHKLKMPTFKKRRRSTGKSKGKPFQRKIGLYKPMRRYFSQPVHRFKRKVGYVEQLDLSLPTKYATIKFQLSGLPNYTEFTALFDQYKIVGVDMQIIYSQNTSAINDPNGIPLMWYVIDRDDNTLPTSIDELRQYDNCQCIRLDKPFHIYITNPKYSSTAWDNAIASGYAQGRGWLQTAYPGIDYYGIKTAIQNDFGQSDTTGGAVRYEATYYLLMKSVK